MQCTAAIPNAVGVTIVLATNLSTFIFSDAS